MPQSYILAIDQGTTGSRAFIFNKQGVVVASSYQEFKQYYPQPGWVAHDADEIWSSCVSVIKAAIKKSRINPSQILGIGITNQRETTVVWDRKTSNPVAKAIVWQCRRTTKLCEQLKQAGKERLFRRTTGLVLDPYFSGTKVRWLLENVTGLRRRASEGKVCFGTIDSWLIWKLTGGKSHATDMTNASRTLLFNIRDLRWDSGLLKILKVPSEILPQAKCSGDHFGVTAKVAGLPSGIPILSVLGDQQAALYGQECFEPGTIKNTYGTGCFAVLNTGKKYVASKNGLLTTIASDDQGRPVYALEGAIFIAGAVVQWLRDELKIIKRSADSELSTKKVKDTQGVYFVPAFAGLGAPYWDADARGIITGLTRGANADHIVRAALESMAYQTHDVFGVMDKEFSGRTRELKVDGGACQNDFLMQFQADILGRNIVRPKMIDTTVKGAAYLAGVKAGLWSGKKDLKKLNRIDKVFRPKMSPADRKVLLRGWHTAVERARLK